MSDTVRDVISAVLVLSGATMCFAAGVGIIRFPDVLSRLHAATKPQIFGLIAIMVDVALNNSTIGTITLIIAIVVFQSLTAPVVAHLVARAAYDSHRVRIDVLIVDELGTRPD